MLTVLTDKALMKFRMINFQYYISKGIQSICDSQGTAWIAVFKTNINCREIMSSACKKAIIFAGLL